MSGKLHVVCPKCSTINRVPAGRASQGPVCGKCQTPLLPKKPQEVGGRPLPR